MSIHFTELVSRLGMPSLFLNVADNDVFLDHGVYPATMAVNPDPETVYIGYNEEILELIDKFKDCGTCLNFISRDNSPEMEILCKQYGFNIFCTKGTTSQIYYLANLILSSDGELSYPNNPVNRFVAEILDGKIETVLEMNTKTKETGLAFKSRFILLLIKPVLKLTDQLYREIKELEIGFEISIYKGSILVFIEAQNAGEHPEIDYIKLESILEKYNAHAAISTTSTRLTSLPLFYEQCLDTIRVASLLYKNDDIRIDSNEKIFFVEDNLMYLAIDALGETAKYKHNKITYLSSPLLMKLYRYDKQNNDNLYKVTEEYIMSGKSITHTAQRLFLHRNTVKYKLEKAESIMQKSFEDIELCNFLHFSFMIYRYVMKIWNIDADTLLPQPQKNAIR